MIFAGYLAGLLNISSVYIQSSPYAVLISPEHIKVGEEFRILVVSEKPIEKSVIEVTIDGNNLIPSREKSSIAGAPYWWAGYYKAFHSGTLKVFLKEGEKIVLNTSISIRNEWKKGNDYEKGDGTWITRRKWSREMENLYSAWLEILFYDEPEGASWNSLHAVTRNPERNFLYNHLNLGEDDQKGLRLEPDCADNPFFLRAYFSWKLGLPFGFHSCSRGSIKNPPSCSEFFTNETTNDAGGKLEAFSRFLSWVSSKVHSSTARTPLPDQETDLYPVSLTRESLKPGTVFADPYGHTLTLIRWIPQTKEKPGVLLAVDAQPDGTVGIKRFWRGNFLFSTEKVAGSPGFKAFRPLVRFSGSLRFLRNEEIKNNPDYGNFSLIQENMDSESFYDAMEKLINPAPLDPFSAYLELHKSLYEQLLVRVTSVQNGEDFLSNHPSLIIPMPDCPNIFQSKGYWEDYSTPSRDMRLLIAMDVVLIFPDKVEKKKDLFKVPSTETIESIKDKLKKLHEKLSNEMKITYRGSDGKEKELTLKEIFERISAFEVAYNPNDCIEIRWGAKEGSEEIASCKRHAPPDQSEKMKLCRKYFQERKYPVRE